MPHGIYVVLAPRPGIELMPPEVELNHWPTREGPAGMFSMTHSMAGTVLGTEDMKVNNTRSYLSWSS